MQRPHSCDSTIKIKRLKTSFRNLNTIDPIGTLSIGNDVFDMMISIVPLTAL